MDVNEIRLGTDGIREAVCEFRFEATSLPEITIGRLTDAAAWQSYEQMRLPTADLPEQLRAADENLRFQPSYQLTNPTDPADFVRVGPNMVSCHRAAPYPGWDSFGPVIRDMLGALFQTVRSARIIRGGFRYINALSGETHFVSSAADLNVTVAAGDASVADTFVLVYSKELSNIHGVQVTVATPKFVQAPEGPGFDMLIDIDVSTPKGVVIDNADSACEWVEVAHTALKKEFFKLLPSNVVGRLKG
ncbi:hypothetical protein DMC47_00790 [Nostoc sp. 3335mG]|nr:hypothetical protein DMC47_00790 [Nostoc sp. 3335mG]